MKVTVIQILTIGGKQLWKEPLTRSIGKTILHPNGIYTIGKSVKKKDLYFCKVDTHKTQMNDFYQWNELNPEDTTTFCWRTFYLIGDHKQLWLSTPHENWEPCTYQELLEHLNEVI